MKYALMLTIVILGAIPSEGSRVVSKSVTKETPTMNKKCPLPGKSGSGCFGYGFSDGVAGSKPRYKCMQCGGQFF